MTDVFDSLLADTCAIVAKLEYGTSADDAYGQPPQDFIQKLASVACRVSTMGGGKEYKVGKEYAKNTFKVFMRPPTQDDSGVPFELDTHYWLKIISANGVTRTSPIYLNIVAVNDPSMLGHHLEVIAEQVIP